MNFSKNYLLASIGLAAVFVMGVIPADISNQVDSKFYGSATLSLLDMDGNELFTQTVHNRVVDQGENFLVNATFATGNAVDEAASIGTICITNDASIATPEADETYTASAFDGDNGITGLECKQDVAVGGSTGTAEIGSLNFVQPTNIATAQTVTGIGVCQNVSGDNNDFNDCADGDGGTGAGILFAIVDTSDVTIGAGESVDITYTFDISSSGD